MAFDNNAKNKAWPLKRASALKSGTTKVLQHTWEKGRKGIMAYQLFHLTSLDNI
jgi:hypothetical protein